MTPHFVEFDEFHLPYAALGELYAGAFRSGYTVENLHQISQLLDGVSLVYPDDETSERYGRIHAQLARIGKPIPQNDIWIAAIAMQTSLPLATSDQHFQHVEGLNVLMW
jgi:tRNA(fMet)-specific endonuclease VapC